MFFSVIIPIFNRPDELRELLESLSAQTFQNFEVLVIEDGSAISSESVCDTFLERLSIRYVIQENQGQGFARNHGMKLAKGAFFILVDSDVILPSAYLELVERAIGSRNLDAFGGPDAADTGFSDFQKAMDFAMTSFWTTGGIRGNLKNPASFQARGFNMGLSRKVFEAVGGFVDPNQGEDIEYSIRIKKAGFTLELIKEAFVYHKRKNSHKSFLKQAFSFGQNRVNVSRYHPEAIKLVHLLPTAFLCFLLLMVVAALGNWQIFRFQAFLFFSWVVLVLLSASFQFRSVRVGGLAVITSLVQLTGYGAGLLIAWCKKFLQG